MIADVAQLYEELAPRLRSIVLRDVNAPAAVIEDACQVAWYRLVRHAHRIERQGALSWLARTAVHEAIKLARRDQRELSLEARTDEDGELNIASPNPGPHEQIEWREHLALVDRLPVRQQWFLWLFAMGHTYEDIAARQAGLTKRTVERQIQHGRRKLNAAA
jgi:RNA polymerase sigma factor (sigma-70 family)